MHENARKRWNKGHDVCVESRCAVSKLRYRPFFAFGLRNNIFRIKLLKENCREINFFNNKSRYVLSLQKKSIIFNNVVIKKDYSGLGKLSGLS